MKQGLMQSSDVERVNIPRLNLGPIQTIVVESQTITVTSTIVNLIPTGLFTTVRTILGGEEGDVLVLTGDRIRLRRGGNIASTVNLSDDEVTLLVLINGLWLAV
jgi:hypothetical protein